MRRTILAFGSALLAFPMLPATAGAPAPGIAQVARIRSSLANGVRHLDVDIAARRLLEIGQPRDGVGMRVVLWDLDTLRRVKEVSLPGAFSGRGGLLSAVDDLHHRLFVVYPSAPAGDEAVRGVLDGAGAGRSYEQLRDEVRTIFEVAAVDTLRGAVLGHATLALAGVAPYDLSQSNGIGAKALSYFRDGDRDLLTLVTEVPSGLGNLAVSNHSVALHELDAARILDGAGASPVNWTVPLPQCALTMARDTPSAVYRSATTPELFVPCRQGGAQGLIVGQPGETPGIVRVRLTPGAGRAEAARFQTEFFPISGNLQYGMVAVDGAAGRMFLKIDGSTTEAAVWAFDAGAAAWVGLLILPPSFAGDGGVALGIDPDLGRLYAVSSLGSDGRAAVVASSTRSAQSDQGAVFRFKPDLPPEKMRPIVDPVRHRIFVRALESYIVLEDRVPPPAQAPASSPDGATVNIAEGEGTIAAFVGGGQSYGARIRWVGGRGGVERNANTVVDNPPSELSPNTGDLLPAPPATGSRDLHLARVFHATLSNGEATAKATAAERDVDNTDADLKAWTRYLRLWGGPDLSGERWPYPTVECTDFGGEPRESKGAGALVRCSRAERTVSALAADESLGAGDILRIARSRARTYVVRDARRGVISVSEAEVFGVDVGGRFGIGRVAARAETWATGRPRLANGVGAGSRYHPTFEDVWVVDTTGARRTVCGTACRPEDVRDAFNRVFGVRARLDLPRPEPARAAGTPGGYEALVVRDPFERADEAALNDETDDRRLEVPAAVLTLFADGRVSSRVVLSLAAVSAESHYGISLISQGVVTTPPDRPFPPLPGNGGFIAPPGTAPPPAPPAGSGASVLRKVLDGIRLTFSSPARAARAAGLWLLLAAPLILVIRRRAFGRGGGPS